VWLESALVAGKVDPDDVDTALLLTSELVTNAVVHGYGGPRIEVRRTADDLWIGVEDTGNRLPCLAGEDVASSGGRGMRLVNALADGWGVGRPVGGGGKTVWFQLHRSHLR